MKDMMRRVLNLLVEEFWRDMAEDIAEINESSGSVKTKEDANTRMVKNVLKTFIDEIGINIDETK